MARTFPDRTAATPKVVLDAVSLLTRDHRLVDEMFSEFARSLPQQLDPLARRICKMLRVHAQIEEEIFYPAARRALGDEALIDRAEQEHTAAKQTMARLESMTSEHAAFQLAMTSLQQMIVVHVAEEETQLFPRLRRTSFDGVAVGIAMADRRDVLLDVLGLHDDDEEGAANQRDTRASAARTTPDART